MMILGCCLAVEILRVFLGDNFHQVVPGLVFRGSCPSPESLERMVKRHGIRTVVNLRGLCNDGWYFDECRIVQKLGISLQDLALAAGRLPPAQEVRRLVKIIENAEYPMFFHCYRGADRTGLASVFVKILRTDAGWDEARGQLHWRYGHVALSRPAYLDAFFDIYTDWLKRQHREHSRETFRHWAMEEYRGGWCDYHVEEWHKLEPAGPHQPLAYHVKMRNTGTGAWNFTTHARAGFHLGFRVQDERGDVVLEGRAGLRDHLVLPGQSFSETVVVPPTLKPGRYLMTLDLVDESQGWFFQMGMNPVQEEFVIRE